MIAQIMQVSKVASIVLMALYTLQSFIVLGMKQEKRRDAMLFLQGIVLLFLHFSCFLAMFLKRGNPQLLFLYGAQLIYLIAFMVIARNLYPRASKAVFNHMSLLIMIGLVLNARLHFDKGIRHFFLVVIASVFGLLVPVIIARLKALASWGWLFALLGLGALVLVILMARISGGAQLGFDFGLISIQPSEFVKITFVFAVAGLLHKEKSFLNICLATGVAGLHVLLLVYSKDLGGALIYFVTYLVMLAVASRNLLYPILGVMAGSGACVLAYRIFPHVAQRVSIWQDPFADFWGSGYQIGQSLFSIAAGGWFGRGLMQGSPNTIPVVEKDMMLSAIAEEMGSVFTILLLLVCLSCFFEFVRIAMQLSNRFYRIVGMGLGTVYGVQVFLTAGGAMKLLPLTGVTLPLISYGGSSMLSTMMIFMIIQGMFILRQDEENQVEIPTAEGELYVIKRYFLGSALSVSTFFVILIGYLIYFNTSLAAGLNQHAYTTKFTEAADNVVRGDIYSSDGELLAKTNVDQSGNEKRSYPWGYFFAHVIGYADNGKAGMEAVYDKELMTVTPSEKEEMEEDASAVEGVEQSVASWDTFVDEVQENAKQEAMDAKPKTEQGDSLYLTLDARLQMTAYNAMAGYKGAVVCMETKTGRILAMVSRPDFDPNEIGEMWESLNDPNADSPLLNRATQGLYAPGSTFKIVTALEYIKEHPEEYQDYRYNCDGLLRQGNAKIKCYHGSVHGYEDLQESFQHSCNTSFANIGLGLDIKKFQKTSKSVLFDENLPIEIPYSKSRFYLNSQSDEKEIAGTAIGQGKTLVSPFHMALIVSAIANNGKLMKPYLLDRIQNAQGQIVEETKPVEERQLVSQKEATILQSMMRSVVEGGTGSKLDDQPYIVAGKTGSAEYKKKGYSGYLTHSWFAGYAKMPETDAAEITIVVIAEDGGSGSETAVPIVKEILDAYYNE